MTGDAAGQRGQDPETRSQLAGMGFWTVTSNTEIEFRKDSLHEGYRNYCRI